MPHEGKDVHIEGKYDSCSTLILARIPMAVWNLLPENPAYSFVGFVTSGNMINELSAAIETAVEEPAVHPTPGVANDPNHSTGSDDEPPAISVVQFLQARRKGKELSQAQKTNPHRLKDPHQQYNLGVLIWNRSQPKRYSYLFQFQCFHRWEVFTRNQTYLILHDKTKQPNFRLLRMYNP